MDDTNWEWPVVYLAGPMIGHTVGQALNWRLRIANLLNDHKINHEMPYDSVDWFEFPDDFVLTAKDLTAADVRVIWQADKAIVEAADAVFADMRYANRVSIGTVQEIAWAVGAKVPVVLLLPVSVDKGIGYRDSKFFTSLLHRHPFLLEQAAWHGTDEDEAIAFLVELLRHKEEVCE